jgi:RHS repeat-associated protein/uncharacterized repeat protein (TIGR01451 family)
VTTPLPAWPRLLLTFALLLPTILPALADGVNRPPAASTSASTFVSPLPPPTPAPLPAPRLTLTLDAAPAWAEPGEVVTFTVTATNVGDTPLAGLTLTDALPDGLRYAAGSTVGFTYTASARQLTWQPAALAASVTITGSFQARVQGLALGATVTNTVTATGAGLTAPIRASATVEVVSPRHNEAWVTPGQGGLLRSTDDRVLLRVPAGATGKRTRFTYAPVTDVPHPPPGLRFAFRLEAADEQGQAVREFPVLLELTIADSFGQTAAPGLLYYDEAAGRWQPVPMAIAPGRRQGWVRLDHLTLFALASSTTSDDIVPQVMPSIRGIQSDLFTGAATIQHEIPLPPGAGGFTPRLALQFNSRSRQDDQGTSSLLGTGWNLTLDSWVADGWLLGGAKTIWRIDGVSYTDGGDHLVEAPDWRISRNNATADAWAPDGRHYHFSTSFANLTYTDPSWRYDTAKWLLDWVQDPAGNLIRYKYERGIPVDARQVDDAPGGYQGLFRDYQAGDIAQYLYQNNLTGIAYNTPGAIGAPIPNYTWVQFLFDPAERGDFPSTQAIVGTDYCNPYDPDGSDIREAAKRQFFYTRRLLRGIRILQRQPPDAIPAHPASRSGYEFMAGYKLDYDIAYDANCAPKVRYALKSIAQCSTDDSNQDGYNFGGCLPAMSFTNAGLAPGSNGRVTEVNNGYGGYVGFTYSTTEKWTVTQKTISDSTTGQADTWSYTYSDKVQSNVGGTVGFNQVTETLPAGPGSNNTIYHRFLSGNDAELETARGKEDLRQHRVNGVLQAEVVQDWLTTNGLTLLNWAEQRAYDSSGTSYQPQQTRYYYELDHQGNTQYGNATRIEDYSDAGLTLYRTTERWYKPHAFDGSYYQAHLLAQEKLWPGPIGGSCQGQTRYIYDTTGLSNWLVAPTWGQLREVWRAQACDSANAADWVRQAAYDYDAWGNRTAATAANGATTTTSYDSQLHVYPLSVTVQPGAGGGAALTTSYQYYGLNGEASGQGLFGQLQSVTDPNGAVTRYRYDDWGRVTELRRPAVDPPGYSAPCSGFACAATEVYGYVNTPPFTIYHAVRNDAQPDSVTTASYRQDWTFYDGLGQVIQTQVEGATPAQGVLVSQGYNALGLVVSQTVPYFGAANGVYQPLSAWAGKTSTTTYDALGRTTRVTQPDGTWVDTIYNGRQTAVVDALRHQTIREVDAFGRLISVKQYTNVATPPSWTAPVAFQASYAYNVRDQLEQVTGSDGAVSDPAYDLLGRKVSLSDADMGAWQYRYDAASNLVKQRDARNQALCFCYDGHNRLVGKTYHANTPDLDSLTCPNTGFVVSYGYDAGANGLGRRTSLTDASGATSWSYDARGRVANETKTIGTNTFVTGHSYRSDDRPATLTYPDGEALTYGYDAAGQLTTLSGAQESWGGAAPANYLSAATYTALGQPLSRVYSNTLTLGYGYHPTSYRLATLTAPGVSLGYTYQNNGNVASLSDGGATTTFTYDDLDRLKTATGGYSASYTYDPNGNLRTKTEGGVTVNLTYPAGKHAPGSVNGQTYTYTGTGNLIARPGQSFSYDAENRLTQVVSGTVTTTFTYDGDGNLVQKVTPEGTTLYIGPHYEVRPLPASPPPLPPPPLPPTLTKRSFLPLVANNTLSVDGRPAQIVKYYLIGGQRSASRIGSAGPVTYYYHDHLGSTTASSGGESTRYWPYGATRSGNIETAYRFTGQRQDVAGLYFYQSRWYDSAIGRFVQPDPLVPDPGNPQALNRYSYTLNNPLKYMDPTGHWPDPVQWLQRQVDKLVASVQEWLFLHDPCTLSIAPACGGLVPFKANSPEEIAKSIASSSGMPLSPETQEQLARFSAAFRVGVTTWNQFQAATGGVFENREEAGNGWNAYKLSKDSTDTLVLGRQPDTAKWEGTAGYQVLNLPEWSIPVNDSWIQGGIDRHATFRVVSPLEGNLWNEERDAPTVMARELQMLLNAGYRQEGEYWRPPTP